MGADERPPARPGARRRRALLIAIGSTLAALALAEGVARSCGLRPWITYPAAPTVPCLHDPDPVIGWVQRPGEYRLGPLSPSGTAVRVTIDPGGARSTSRPPRDAARTVVVVGGSFTQGWGVADEETYAWQLAERFPDTRFVNYGTAGYGTLQSLQRLERHFAEGGRADLVVYGFLALHAERNVGDPGWAAILAAGASRGHLWLPRAELDERGELVRREPARYPVLPLSEHSALLTGVQGLLARARFGAGTKQRAEVTWRLIRELERTSREHGARFLVAVLGWRRRPTDPWVDRLRREGVEHADLKLDLAPELAIPDDGHPSAVTHARWAELLAPRVRDLLPER